MRFDNTTVGLPSPERKLRLQLGLLNCMCEDAMLFPVLLGHVAWLVATTLTSFLLLGSDDAQAASLAAARIAPSPDIVSGERQIPALSESVRGRVRRADRHGSISEEDELQTVDYTHQRPWQINRGGLI